MEVVLKVLVVKADCQILFPALWIVAAASAALSTPHSGSVFELGYGAPGLTRTEPVALNLT